jgi:hypothetical protein
LALLTVANAFHALVNVRGGSFGLASFELRYVPLNGLVILLGFTALRIAAILGIHERRSWGRWLGCALLAWGAVQGWAQTFEVMRWAFSFVALHYARVLATGQVSRDYFGPSPEQFDVPSPPKLEVAAGELVRAPLPGESAPLEQELEHEDDARADVQHGGRGRPSRHRKRGRGASHGDGTP